MDHLYLGIVCFLFALAIFDLTVGVSNDAVNFLNSAIGSKAASFRTILIVAGIGVFVGASMSNGMMDIARHGMFKPQYFYFGELMYVFMAVIVTDVILLDIFNTMGMPTSTTVSMVFELLGASFTIAVIKHYTDPVGLSIGEYINTEKALTVILGIFLSVAIAFTFGAIVQYITRLIFTFNFQRNLKWKIGIFGGIAATCIIYFMLLKGVKDMSFMTQEWKNFIDENTGKIVIYSFIFFTILMQILHAVGVNVFKVVVLMGTFSLALAFAGNDLVNFIGVPLAGFSSYIYYMEGGGAANDVMSFTMERLNDPAGTPIYFLVTAGLIMVIALATSKKAHNVVKTSVDLARQEQGEEMFDSSRVARRLVRGTSNVYEFFEERTPLKVQHWVNHRFDQSESCMPEGAAFDLVRASINLVLAGLLVALGTSLKLPLSTTYVTFMVAMGSSLSDRAWGRESAVFRITGVLSVIAGWLLTAFSAFLVASIVVVAMYFGGIYVTILIALLAMVQLVRSNIKYSKNKKRTSKGEEMFRQIAACKDKARTWKLMQEYVSNTQIDFILFIVDTYFNITEGFLEEDLRMLRKANISLPKEKALLKSIRRKQTLGLRKIEPRLAIENNTWLHLSYNSSQQMIYCLMRMNEPCFEHVDNNFTPLPDELKQEFIPIRNRITALLKKSRILVDFDYEMTSLEIRKECDDLKTELSQMRKELVNHIHEDMENYTVVYVYLNVLQESQEMITSLRHMLRAVRKIEKVK